MLYCVSTTVSTHANYRTVDRRLLKEVKVSEILPALPRHHNSGLFVIFTWKFFAMSSVANLIPPLQEYAGMESFFGGKPPLPLGVGWAIVLGFGFAVAVLTSLIVWINDKVSGKSMITSEHFNTAGRSVKTGLIASVIVSQWTWAATLLQSSNVAWQYGVSGPFW